MEAKEAGCCTTHIITGDSAFNTAGLDKFIEQVKLGECGLSYVVVSIIGPQSSGKSTLLNHLFYTDFKEMDARKRRQKTTEGIWIARCAGIEPCTIVMDIEGTDGKERGEDDTAFERRSALFAMAVSHVVIINIWCNDIGRQNAANIPLLKTVFQVMLRVFGLRKVTFMFVIRDKAPTTPLEILELDLHEDLQKIWDSIPKPEGNKNTKLSDFINVEVVALSHYEYEKQQFKKQVASLRQKFFQSIEPGGLAADRGEVVPASGFSWNAQEIWNRIRQNKDLDLPSLKVMAAKVRCPEIAKEKYGLFITQEDWNTLKSVVASQPERVEDFSKSLSLILENCLSSYDEDSFYYEDGIKSAERKKLEEKLIEHVKETYQLMLEHIRKQTLYNFEIQLRTAMDEGKKFAVTAASLTESFRTRFKDRCQAVTCKKDYWDIIRNQEINKMEEIFSNGLDLIKTEVLTSELNKLTTQYELKFKDVLSLQVEDRLKEANDKTWPEIKKLFSGPTTTAVVTDFSAALSSFGVDERVNTDMISRLKDYGIGLVKEKAREKAAHIQYLMTERFTRMFKHDGSRQRDWTRNENIPAIAETAWDSALKLLSVLAAIGWDGKTARIHDSLKEATRENTTSHHLWAKHTWEEVQVPATEMFISPAQCITLWNRFKRETQHLVTQARDTQNAHEKKMDEERMNGLLTATAAAGAAAVSGAVGVAAETLLVASTGGLGAIGLSAYALWKLYSLI